MKVHDPKGYCGEQDCVEFFYRAPVRKAAHQPDIIAKRILAAAPERLQDPLYVHSLRFVLFPPKKPLLRDTCASISAGA